MRNLKIITTDEFLEKYDNNNLTDEDLEAIYFQKTFKNTNNSYWEEAENGEYYIIFKIVINNFLERYFIKTYYEMGPIFEMKYK
ncbi:hypothetical protein [Fusobacterium hwasookii]|uniref:Uncharacterized protein n=2 Tax=Fusobacterium hwasookii TaxID=1583098 RepID=A0A0S2ZQN4_9FUSO|nr:hypothetical protein [Fusobacterium hwasookii]ALQ35359.1 hypothetical protein RN92_05465 [Fusobacterium hwasookii ChDC F206]ALQ41235.1 hypothetical protein RN87_11795 [Fusobacterium hwasookii ChDC F174]